MTAEKLSIQKLSFAEVDNDLCLEWDQLIPKSIRPSLYATYDYIRLSIKHFNTDKVETTFVLIMRDTRTKELRAIFPLSVGLRRCYKRNVRVLEHIITTHYSDVDKPYPIIDKRFESICWRYFGDYIDREFTQWDWLEYAELIKESQLNSLVKKLFSLPKYFVTQSKGPDSPIVDLSGNWLEFWEAHRNLRKKNRRVEKQFGEGYRYQIFAREHEMQSCLSDYIAVEELSWKAGKGLSDPCGKAFYQELLPLLAKQEKAYFGILYEGETPVSVELSFTYLNTVYFAQGTYHPDYGHLSPGSVSTSKFIQYFIDKGYKDGDFLAGFAHYINAWAKEIYSTHDTVVYKINTIFCYYIFLRFYEKIKEKIKIIRGRK